MAKKKDVKSKVKAKGKAARADTPRSSHAGWRAPQDREDPIAVLESQAQSRVPELVPDALPLHSLSAAREHLATLSRLGCNTWGNVRALPRGGVARTPGCEQHQSERTCEASDGDARATSKHRPSEH